MKKIEINVNANEDSRMQFSFKASTEVQINKLIGIICNEIFERNQLWRKINSKATIKATENIDVTVKTDETVLFDSKNYRVQNAISLKFGKTYKSMHKFASTFYEVVKWEIEHALNLDVDTDMILNSLLVRAQAAGELDKKSTKKAKK